MLQDVAGNCLSLGILGRDRSEQVEEAPPPPLTGHLLPGSTLFPNGKTYVFEAGGVVTEIRDTEEEGGNDEEVEGGS